ncbi:hypothetical protein CROQUDRAFT_55736 [Cronartium quercuum f. sp. fusiforme G11]|uniref:Carbohydrate-binding module family 19 domain-containing protein n=1 Tax=Cronartium quercuum f. sp. fusiforme G11 TaxID=708437 RepID=A0A9P6NS35_9BASI|nr:hypothetical protein CROQUDRAFT_55736 [Cronartium quercuum f. sp. fusiforme G11]
MYQGALVSLFILNLSNIIAQQQSKSSQIFVPIKVNKLYPRSISPEVLLENGRKAQKLNAKYLNLKLDSTCESGEYACVEGGFAQCVNGKFVNMGCATPLKCFELPLLLKAGTTPSCDVEVDAATRIANTGAKGGIRGDGSSSSAAATATNATTVAQTENGSAQNSTSDANNTLDPSSDVDTSPNSTSLNATRSLNKTNSDNASGSNSEDQASASVNSGSMTAHQTDLGADTARKNTSTNSTSTNTRDITSTPTTILPANSTTTNTNLTNHNEADQEDCNEKGN